MPAGGSGAPERNGSRSRWVLPALGVGVFALLLVLEVATEDEAVNPLDLVGDALQIALLVATAMATGGLAARFRSHREEKIALLHDLELARAEGEAWRREAGSYVAGLGAAIDEQFEGWRLTPAEREIGLLMLKGFSHDRDRTGARAAALDPAPGMTVVGALSAA